jgi:hypothetical protein
MLSITEGHVIVVDRERRVAGEVIAAADGLYAAMTRTGWGIVAARDTDTDHRDVVMGSTLQEPFAHDRRQRPAGPNSRRVFALQHGELVATTDHGVEWSAGRGQPFFEVAAWPTGWSSLDPGNHAAFGWLDDGSPALATTLGWVRTHCTSDAGTDP